VISTRNTTILWPLHNMHDNLQEDFVGAKFYCQHVLADGS